MLLFKWPFILMLLSACAGALAGPIHDAAFRGDLAGVERLTRMDAQAVNSRIRAGEAETWAEGGTPLHTAARGGHLEVIKFLIANGADVNARRKDGESAVSEAVFNGHIDAARFLIASGANINNVGAEGHTPLHWAALHGNVDAATLLMERGAEVTIKDKDGRTPVQCAFVSGHIPVVERLLTSERVTLKLENTPFAEALQQLFAAANTPQPVKSNVTGTISLNLTGVPFSAALRAVLNSVGDKDALTYRSENNMLVVTLPDAVKTPTVANAEPIITTDVRYRFYKTISRQTLNNYLSRAVTHYGLCSTSPEPATSCFDDDIRMLTGLGAKFIGRAAYAWVPPDDEEAHFLLAGERARRVHQADPEIVLQAAIFEAVYESIDKIPVPEWVFAEFGLPVKKRNFRYASMLYDKGELHNHWTQGASVPDMSKLETRLYFYYRARRYIDCGFEALHFGQVHLMDHNDTDHRFWLDMLTRVRRYASRQARRSMVLCDAHTHGVHANGRLLFDFHSYPLMAKEVPSAPQKTILLVGYYSSIYGMSEGGVTPSGWSCERLPYLCEFDCGGSSGKPGQPIGFPWHWGYDCGSWFAHQSPTYRKEYLMYADNWLRTRREEAWLQMPTRLNLAVPVEGVKMWQANTRSSACTTGFNQEDTIRAIWNTATRVPQ